MKGWTLDVKGKGNTPAEQVQVGDSVRGFSVAKGTDVFRAVISKHIRPTGAGYIVNGHKVPPIMGVWDGQTWIPAFKIPGATLDGSPDTQVCLNLNPDTDDEHNLWLVGGEPLLIKG